MNDTPETDKMLNFLSTQFPEQLEFEVGLAGFCRKMERERDEARRERNELIAAVRADGKAAYVMEPIEEECAHNMGHELNGVGMWICLGCRADITPELSPSNADGLGRRALDADFK